jgi:hypothetical protein
MMKRLHRKLLIGVAFVFLIAASMWFAAPTFASMTQRLVWSAAQGVYHEPGVINIEKRDLITGNIIVSPGVTFNITPDPYDPNYPVPGSTLTVVDNTFPDTNGLLGYIRLTNVPPGHYHIIEIAAPVGYLVDSTPIPVDVPANGTVTAVSRDMPITRVPGSSSTGLWLMIGIFAALIFGFILWRSRRSQISPG